MNHNVWPFDERFVFPINHLGMFQVIILYL